MGGTPAADWLTAKRAELDCAGGMEQGSAERGCRLPAKRCHRATESTVENELRGMLNVGSHEGKKEKSKERKGDRRGEEASVRAGFRTILDQIQGLTLVSELGL